MDNKKKSNQYFRLINANVGDIDYQVCIHRTSFVPGQYAVVQVFVPVPEHNCQKHLVFDTADNRDTAFFSYNEQDAVSFIQDHLPLTQS